MSLYAHSSLSRVVCEAAVRFAWILDSDVGSEERIMRGAVSVLVSADKRLRSVMSIPAGYLDPRLRQGRVENCTSERDSARRLISGSVTHSHLWGLRDAVISQGSEPLALAPKLMEVGAAAQCAISASGLIISRCAAYYGQDPKPHVQRSQERRATIDQYLEQLARSRPRPTAY